MEEHKEELEEFARTNQNLFLGLLLLRQLGLTKKSKRKIKDEDLEFIYNNYAYLISERKNIMELENKIKSISNFMGLH